CGPPCRRRSPPRSPGTSLVARRGPRAVRPPPTCPTGPRPARARSRLILSEVPHGGRQLAQRPHLAAVEAPRGTVEHGHVDVDRPVVDHLVALALECPAGPAGGDAVAAVPCPAQRGAVWDEAAGGRVEAQGLALERAGER